MTAAAIDVQQKLAELSGTGKLEARISTARGKLARIHSRWRTPQAPGRIKRFLYLLQVPKHEEIVDVRLAYLKHIPERIEAQRASLQESHKQLLASVAALEEQARHGDPEFVRPHIEALRSEIDRFCNAQIQARQKAGH